MTLTRTPACVESAESTWDKISREVDLLAGGLGALPEAAKTALVDHPGETLAKGIASTALSAGLTYATGSRWLVKLGAEALGVGFGVAALADGSKQLSNACDLVMDTWRSPLHFEQDRAMMRNQLAPLAFDTAVSLSGAALGTYAGRSLLADPFTAKLPEFTKSGSLPPGIHQSSWQEFASRYGSTARRQALLSNMETLLQELRKQGADRVYVGGSFVTTKPEPGDFDMTWRVSGERLGELSKKAPIVTDRALQKSTLGGELMATYPNSPGDGVLGFLQQNRGKPVGVVEMDLSTLPSRTSFLLRQTVRSLRTRLAGH